LATLGLLGLAALLLLSRSPGMPLMLVALLATLSGLLTPLARRVPTLIEVQDWD
jgi:hypothetical protein